MACKSCKKTKEEIASEVVSATLKLENKNIIRYIGNFFIFLVLAVLLTPFIIPITLFMMFKIIVLDKNINLLPVVKYLGEKIFKEKDEEEEDEFEDDEDLDEELDEEYEPINEHEIIDISNVQ